MKEIILSLTFCLIQALSAADADTQSFYPYRDTFEEGWSIERKAGDEQTGYFDEKVMSYNFTESGQSSVAIRKGLSVPVDRSSRIKLSFISDGKKQKIFMVLKDRCGESFFLDGGRCFSKGSRTLLFTMDAFFKERKEIDGTIWGGDGNRIFDAPLTEIVVGIDNFPDGVQRKGSIGMDTLEIIYGQQDSGSPGGETHFPSDTPGIVLPQIYNCMENVVLNASFEEGKTGEEPVSWSKSRGVLTKVEGGTDGKYCAMFVMDIKYTERLGAFISQEIDIPGGLKKGDIWFLSGMMRTDRRVEMGIVLAETPSGNFYSDSISGIVMPEDGWMHFLIPYEIQSSFNSKLKLHIYVYEPEKPVFIDDVRLSKAPEGMVLSSRSIGRYATEKTILPDRYEY